MSSATPRRVALVLVWLLTGIAACGRERSLHRPGQLAFSPGGDLLVADLANFRVVRFDRNLDYLGEAGERGIGDGELWSIQGMGALADGGLLVVDHSLARLDDPASDVRRVRRFAADGSALGGFDPTAATGDGEPMGWPGSIAQVPEGIVLGDYERDHLQVFTLDGRYLRAIYARPPAEPFVGTGFVRWAGELLWVAEFDVHRVRGFTLGGEERLKLGAEGTGDGQFLFPDAVDAGPDGAIIVSDIGNYRAVIFRRDGSWERNIVPPPARPGIKVNVADVRFGGDGRIYLSDGKGDRVLVFARDGALLATLASW
jgi:hypothetical protein